MKLVELYGDKVLGAIKGLDRIRFFGTLCVFSAASASVVIHREILRELCAFVVNIT